MSWIHPARHWPTGPIRPQSVREADGSGYHKTACLTAIPEGAKIGRRDPC